MGGTALQTQVKPSLYFVKYMHNKKTFSVRITYNVIGNKDNNNNNNNNNNVVESSGTHRQRSYSK